MPQNNQDPKALKTLQTPLQIIFGTVVVGRQDGRKIGFPTANIEPIDLQALDLLPKGVYATRIKVHKTWYKSATSYGSSPVFGFDKVVLESHILDFDQDIYGQIVELEIIQFLRTIQNCNSLEELITQIKLDCQITNQIVTLPS
jgi:riboflavin kinase / FMN adenylyltransferase